MPEYKASLTRIFSYLFRDVPLMAPAVVTRAAAIKGNTLLAC